MAESAAPASIETTAAAATETGAAAPPTPPPAATLWTLESLQKEQVRTMPGGYTLVQAWGDAAVAEMKKASKVELAEDMLVPNNKECEVLLELKNALAKRPELSGHYTDWLLIRITRGIYYGKFKKMKVGKLEATVNYCILCTELRHKYKLDTIHSRDITGGEIYRKYVAPFPKRFSGTDANGRVILLLQSPDKPGTKELAALAVEDILLNMAQDEELCHIAKAKISAEKGYMIYRHIILCDFSNLYKNGARKLMQRLNKFKYKDATVSELLNPEQLFCMWCLMSPWWLRGAWDMVKKLMDPALVSKMQICRGVPFQRLEAAGISKEVMPEGYQGFSAGLTQLKMKGRQRSEFELKMTANHTITWLVEVEYKGVKVKVEKFVTEKSTPEVLANGVAEVGDPASGEVTCTSDGGKIRLTITNSAVLKSRLVNYSFASQPSEPNDADSGIIADSDGHLETSAAAAAADVSGGSGDGGGDAGDGGGDGDGDGGGTD